jgi:osmotically-inducible protein OsmY
MLEEERFLLVKIINLLIISLLVNSCAIISTTGSLVGSASTSTRGFSGTIEDTYLMSKIVSKITLMKLSNFSNITVSVINGKVLLAGNIENQEKRLELIKKVWWIDGVKEVLNELEIGPRTSFSEKAEDFVFEAKIEKRLLFEPGIFSNNYSVDVVNGKVYVMGISSDIEEKTKVENFLNNMNDIKKLILLLDIPKIIKDGK